MVLARTASGEVGTWARAASATSGGSTSAPSGAADAAASGAGGTMGWSSGSSTSDGRRSFAGSSLRPNVLITRAIYASCACRSPLLALQTAPLHARTGLIRAKIASNMRRPANGAHVSAHTSPDRVARGVQIVSWLMGRPAGDTLDELGRRFGWPTDELRDVIDHLARRCQVTRVGQRYLATPEHMWRTGTR